MKKINLCFHFLLLAALLSGCQSKSTDIGAGEEPSAGEVQTSDSDTVNLTVWGAEEDEELLGRIIDGFKEEYRGQAEFVITYSPQSESSCTDAR